MAIIDIKNGKVITEGKYKGEKRSYKTLASVRRLINYILRADKTNDLLKGGIFCNPNTAYDEFILTKAIHGKLPKSEISRSEEVIQLVQGFDGYELTPELAKEIAGELMEHELFKGFQVVYAVHTDTGNLHTHFAINTVNYETGLRWHISKNDLQKIKDYSDELCLKHNLSIIPKREKFHTKDNRLTRHMSYGEHRARKEGRSWKAETLHAGMAAKKVALNKEEFIEIMQSMGYKVRWEDSRKDITYTNPDEKKINSDKLGFPDRNYTPLTKLELEEQFARNRQVKENNNETVLVQQERLKHHLLKLASNLTKENNGEKYPFQNNAILNSNKLEGQALKDKLKESQLGKGFDWEQE